MAIDEVVKSLYKRRWGRSSICTTFLNDKEDVMRRADKAVARLVKKYGQPYDYGRNRIVFMSKHAVIKFPRNHAGIGDNDWEGSCSGPTLAKGRMIYIEGFICVMQERVQRIYQDVDPPKNMPKWTWTVDCAQVGYTPKGVLKAYDFGRR